MRRGRVQSRRWAIVAAVLAMLVPAPPAQASTGIPATCTASWHIDFDPGIDLTPRTSTFTTHGETGTITCTGRVNGHTVTGPGTTGSDGAYHGTTARGSGNEHLTATIPTTAGPQVLGFITNLTVFPRFGFKESDAFVGGLGAFVFVPTKGNGITNRVEQIFVIALFTLKS